MAHKTYNVGIVGYGLSAKVFHIPLIEVVPELCLYAVVQRRPTPDNDVLRDHPGVKVYNAAEEMVKDGSIDIVVVTTPPATHFELAKLALENNKHVIVEKPFVPTTKEANDLIALAKKHQKLLTVYQNRRWDSDFLALKTLIKEANPTPLGRIVDFESHFDRYKPSPASSSTTKAWKTRPEPGGGAIYDLGTHLIDQIVVLFGLPGKITAFLGSQRVGNTGGGYEDACTVLLHYDGGMMATVKVAVVSAEAAQLRFWYHEDCQEAHLTQGMKPGDDGFGIEPDEWNGTLTTVDDGNLIPKSYPTVRRATYKDFYTQFVQAVDGRGEVPVKPEDAASVIRLVELAKESSEQGRTLDVNSV
ncbi:MAG: hypothetical protein Q9216_004493 [Gyalolechia sp. 2 TL-2023]